MEETQHPAILELKEKIGARQAQAKLAAALAKAQGEFKPVAKNRAVQIRMKEGGTYRFEYADLEQLISCTRPALAANGLAVVQRVSDDKLVTELIHAEGGSLRSSSDLPRMGQDPKSYGAAITYLRRYAYSALLCLAADDDLDEDGQGAEEPGTSNKVERAEPQRKPKQEGVEAAPASPAQIKWVKDRLSVDDTAAKKLEQLGISNLDKLTKPDFERAKAALLGV